MQDKIEKIVGDFLGMVTSKTERQVRLITQMEALMMALLSSLEAMVKQLEERAEKLTKKMDAEVQKSPLSPTAQYWQGRIEEMRWTIERIEEIFKWEDVSGSHRPQGWQNPYDKIKTRPERPYEPGPLISKPSMVDKAEGPTVEYEQGPRGPRFDKPKTKGRDDD
jgi:hypothetical protein